MEVKVQFCQILFGMRVGFFWWIWKFIYQGKVVISMIDSDRSVMICGFLRCLQDEEVIVRIYKSMFSLVFMIKVLIQLIFFVSFVVYL